MKHMNFAGVVMLTVSVSALVLLTACDSRPYDRAAVAKAQGNPPPSTRASEPPSEITRIYRAGNAMKDMKLIDRFEIHYPNLDLYLSSMLPGDARDVAAAVCHPKMNIPHGLTIRAFLVVGDRPAATCTTEGN
jgi:hypothetical protein